MMPLHPWKQPKNSASYNTRPGSSSSHAIIIDSPWLRQQNERSTGISRLCTCKNMITYEIHVWLIMEQFCGPPLWSPFTPECITCENTWQITCGWPQNCYSQQTIHYSDSEVSWGQHGAYLGPTGPRWAPCWPQELRYLGYIYHTIQSYTHNSRHLSHSSMGIKVSSNQYGNHHHKNDSLKIILSWYQKSLNPMLRWEPRILSVSPF